MQLGLSTGSHCFQMSASVLSLLFADTESDGSSGTATTLVMDGSVASTMVQESRPPTPVDETMPGSPLSVASTIVQESRPPTPVDESMPGSLDFADGDDFCGLLLSTQQLLDPYDSQFDSQVTVRSPTPPLRRLLPRAPSPLPYHFTQDLSFWDSVKDTFFSYMYDDWFEWGRSLDMLGRCWEDNVAICSNLILSIVNAASEFKIGITVDPKWRYFECGNGAYSRQFTKMTIVYAAQNSKKAIQDSSGMMEVELIAKFRFKYPGCLNKSIGGEGASAGSPHFTYIVHN